MIILRKPRILYIPDINIEGKENDSIFDVLKKYIKRLKFAKLSPNPEKGGAEFCHIDFRKYDMAIGYSLGGLYAQLLDEMPVLIINPAFGISKTHKEYRYLDNEYTIGNCQNDQAKVILGKHDPDYDVIYKNCKKRKFKILEYPGTHIPTPEEIRQYIMPVVSEMLKNIE